MVDKDDSAPSERDGGAASEAEAQMVYEAAGAMIGAMIECAEPPAFFAAAVMACTTTAVVTGVDLDSLLMTIRRWYESPVVREVAVALSRQVEGLAQAQPIVKGG